MRLQLTIVSIALAAAAGCGSPVGRSSEGPPADDGLAALRRAVEADYPDVWNPGTGDLERVTMLRSWTHAHVPSSSARLLLDERPSFRYHSRTAPEIFAAFAHDEGGVWCGGNATALVKLYRASGYDAFAVDSGVPGVMTHVMAIVRIEHDGNRIWSVQDSLFDLTYAGTAGGPLDYFDLLTALSEQDHASLRVVQGDAAPTRLILGPGESLDEHRWALGEGGPIETKPDGRRVYPWSLTLGRFDARFGRAIRDHLRSVDEPAELVYLFRYPIRMWGGPEPEAAALADRARAIFGDRI